MGTSANWDAVLNGYEGLDLSGFAYAITQVEGVAQGYGGLPPMTPAQLDHLKNIAIARWTSDPGLITVLQGMSVTDILTDPDFYALSYTLAHIFTDGYVVTSWQKFSDFRYVTLASTAPYSPGWQSFTDVRSLALTGGAAYSPGWQRFSEIEVVALTGSPSLKPTGSWWPLIIVGAAAVAVAIVVASPVAQNAVVSTGKKVARSVADKFLE